MSPAGADTGGGGLVVMVDVVKGRLYGAYTVPHVDSAPQSQRWSLRSRPTLHLDSETAQYSFQTSEAPARP
jgi:hypothetical protein